VAEKSEKSGRGRNGMAFIYNSDIVLASPIEFYGNRIGLMELQSTAIIGVYMAYNNGTSDCRDELESDLSTVTEIMKLMKSKGKECVVVGDFNVDFIKINNFTRKLIDFMALNDFIAADIEYGNQAIDYTWFSIRYDDHKKPYMISSWVDHLLVQRLTKLVGYVEIIKSDQNDGDHNCIRFTLNSSTPLVQTIELKKKKYKLNLNWNRPAVTLEYSKKVELELNKLNFIFQQLVCTDEQSPHLKSRITNAQSKLNDTLVFCKNRIINLYAYTKQPKRKYGIRAKNWWCSTLQEYMEQMKNAYVEYKNSGFQQLLKEKYVEIKRLFRCRKRYNIRLHRDKNVKKLDDLFKLDRDSFWRKVKSSQVVKEVIEMPLDQATEEYKELFNVPFESSANKVKIENELAEMLKEKDNTPVTIELDTVKEIIRELKNGKATGYHGISNEMVKYALNAENEQIAKCYKIIFQKMIDTAIVPDECNISIIKPIIKDNKKRSNNKSNLRPVAVSNVSDSMYEKIVARIVRKECETSPKQFGFKKNSSCSHAIFVLKQIIKYARLINKRVYMCAIDASKAFDKVIRLILWWKLAKKGLNRKVLKSLMAYYKCSKMKVQVNEESSSLFESTVGNKQGGPISPDLFNEYGDELTEWISSLDVGIWMGSMKIDIVQYADDITLVASTAAGLQKQIDVCNEYGKEYGIQFNPDKTTIMVFNTDCVRSIDEIEEDSWQGPFKLAEKTVEVTSTMKILGQILSSDGKDLEHINKRKLATNTMISRLQALNLNSAHIHPKMKAQMFKSYIRPVLTSGTENMELNGSELLAFKKLEGNALKRLLRIPIRCHTTDLFDALNIEQTNRYLKRMKCKFMARINKNEYTKKIAEFICNLKCDNTFTSHLAKTLGMNQDYDYDALVTTSEFRSAELNAVKKPSEDMCNMVMVNKLKIVFNTKNRFAIADKLFDLLKFENFNYDTINRYTKPKKKTCIIRITIKVETIVLFLFFLIFFLYIFMSINRILS